MLGVGAALGAALSFKQIAVCDVIGLTPLYWVALGQKASLRKVLLSLLAIVLRGAAVMAWASSRSWPAG